MANINDTYSEASRTATSEITIPSIASPTNLSIASLTDLSIASPTDPRAIDWAQLPDYQPLSRHSNKPRRGWVWKYGYEIERRSDSRRLWICQIC
jgi:hypothetical protein